MPVRTTINRSYWGLIMSCITLRVAALAITVASLPMSSAFAHCFVGERFFPATLVTDDPCVADEMSLPTVDYFPTAGIGAPAGKEVDVEADISKRITADFDVDIQYTWTQIRTPNSPTQAGFSDLETTFQYQLLKYAPTELAFRSPTISATAVWRLNSCA